MEQQFQQTESTTFSQQPTYQQPQKAKNASAKWLIIFILLLVLGGAGIFFFSKSASEPIATPTPSFGVVPIDTPVATSTPLSTPAAVTNRDEVTIQILNGTGITGEAKLLSDRLEKLGYSEITAANADTTDNTITTVTFSKDLSQAVQDEIKKELESFYKEVNVKTSTTQKTDVVIITGLRSGQTAAKPTATSTSKATATASPKPSASPAN